MTTKQLAGRSAIVTGSTSGIGRAIAQFYAREGANVMINGFGDAKEIESLRASLAKDSGAKAVYHGADMSKPAEIEAMVRAAEKEFGAVDILVNNAGIQHVAPVDEFPPEKWDAIIAINLTSAFHATAPRAQGHEGAPVGPRDQHRLGARAGGVAQQERLRGREARHRRLHQDRGAGGCGDRRALQRHLPRASC